MRLRLEPIEAGADPESLIDALAPGFGADAATAREIIGQTLTLLTEHPRPAPWGSYIAYRDETPVGTCAFKFAPDPEGTVEIAYMTFPLFERQGLAKAMIEELGTLAAKGGAATLIAHTLPEENASNRALRSNGYVFAGEVQDPEDGLVWRWEKARA